MCREGIEVELRHALAEQGSLERTLSDVCSRSEFTHQIRRTRKIGSLITLLLGLRFWWVGWTFSQIRYPDELPLLEQCEHLVDDAREFPHILELVCPERLTEELQRPHATIDEFRGDEREEVGAQHRLDRELREQVFRITLEVP